MTMEKEQELQERNHVRMNLEMIHHDHEKYDQVQHGQEQKLYVNTIGHIVHIRAGAKCVCGIERQKRSLSS